MDKKDLKKVLKPLIRECILEIMAENFIDKKIQEIVVKNAGNSIPEQKNNTKSVSPTKEALRKLMLENAEEPNPYTKSTESDGRPPQMRGMDPNFGKELVSEDQILNLMSRK